MMETAIIRGWSSVVFASVLMAGLRSGAEQVDRGEPELSLSQAIEIALRANRPVQITLLDVTKAQWQVAATKTKRFPQISTDLFGSGNLTSPSFTFKQGTFGQLNGGPNPAKDIKISLSHGLTGFALAQVTQPLTQLYQIGLAVREQELSADLAREKYHAQRESVVADVKQGYYAVLQTESALDAAEATVKQYQETDRVTLQYVAQRSVLQSNSLEVKAKLAQAGYQVAQLRDTLLTQKEHLNLLLGRDLDTAFRAEAVPLTSKAETDLELARHTALAQRPEIKEAEIDTRRSEYDRKLAKAEYLPDIGAALHYFTPFHTEILPQNVASAGLEMKWDVFDWGKRRADVRQKTAVVQQSKYQLDETRSQVLLDVDNSFRKLAESRALLSVAEAGRAAADEKMREVNDQYSKSVLLLRDVLQQQAAVAEANNQYQESLLAFWSAKANFEKALGEE